MWMFLRGFHAKISMAGVARALLPVFGQRPTGCNTDSVGVVIPAASAAPTLETTARSALLPTRDRYSGCQGVGPTHHDSNTASLPNP